MAPRELREVKRLFDALQNSGHMQYKAHLGYLQSFLERTPSFRSVLQLLDAPSDDFDVDAWIAQEIAAAKQTCHRWPAREIDRLRVLLKIFYRCATNAGDDPIAIGMQFIHDRNSGGAAAAFTEQIVHPLLVYLETRLDSAAEMLHHLERLRRQVGWFEQEALYARYVNDPAHGEEVYDRRTREFLFAEGIDYPIGQPDSPSGWADVVADLDTEDPLVCEIKLYDAEKYCVSYLQKGVGQAVRYAHAFGKDVAYLVVFNLSDERLQLPSDAEGSPGRLHVEGVTVFLVVIQAKPLPSASKDRQRKVHAVARAQLVPSKDGEESAGN